MTRKLFYQDPYQFEFSAQVLSCPAEDDHFVVILDQSCFYPGGGGQPADHGWLNEIPVSDVQVRNGEILHYTRTPLPEGAVKGRIDFRRRFDFMQQHTGQHIFSRSLQTVGNYRTLSVHFGEDYTAIEVDAAEIPEEKLLQAEELANRIVQENRPVTSFWLEPDQAVEMGLWTDRKTVEEVRIVEIADFDRSACGGTHVKSTGEVGWIKVVQQERIRGHLRVHLKIGLRARVDYQRKIRLLRELSRTLTCGEEELLTRVQNLQAELRQSQKAMRKLQAELMGFRAREAREKAQPLGKGHFIARVFQDVSPAALKAFVQEIIRHPGYLALAISKNGAGVSWVLGHSWPGGLDLRLLVEPLLPLLSARGGGEGHLLQGGGRNPAGIELFVGKLKEKLQQEIVA